MKTGINKIKDRLFQGFKCQICGREIKYAYSYNGKGVYGSECVMEVAGYNNKNEKRVKELKTLDKIWAKIVSSPEVYNLNEFVRQYGSIEQVEALFFEKRRLC